MVELIHIGISGSLPGGAPHLSHTGLIGGVQLGSVGQIVHGQGEADLGKGVGGVLQDQEGGVVALTAAADVDLYSSLAPSGAAVSLPSVTV